MTQDEIIAMARQAGLFTHKEVQPEIVTFAKLVAEKVLEHSKQEPEAWIHIDPDKPKVKFLEWKENEHGYRGKWIKKPLYTHPTRGTWVGLTGEDVVKAYDDYQLGRVSAGFMGAVRAIEAKLKQKNGYAEEKNT